MEQLPKIVRERLQKSGAGDHPDADLLAAFAENALPEAERPAVVEHLSRCAECREVVMLATNADDQAADEAAANPAVEPIPAQAPHAWFRRPALRWAALAACAALAIAVVVGREWKETNPAETDLAAHVARPQKNVAHLEAKAPSKAEDRSAGTSVEKPEKPTLSASAVPPPAKRHARNAKRSMVSAPANVLATGPQVRSATSMPSNPAVAPPAGLKEIPPRAAAGEVTADSAEARAVTAFAPAVPPSEIDVQAPRSPAAAGGAIAGVVGGVPATQSLRVATLEKGGSAKPQQWTLSPEGVLEHSADFGKTWTKVEVGNGSRFRALSALGSNIWAGGAHGLLFHSADAGEHWKLVHPTANGVTLTATIIHIDFTNAREGRLTTSTGETWTTTDAGRTWQKR